MKAYFLFYLVLLLLNAGPAHSQTIPKLEGRVTDPSHLITKEQTKQLETAIKQAETATNSIYVAVLLQKQKLDTSIENFAGKVADAWGLGKKGKDNGLLIILAVGNGQSRIETGKGLEGAFPDLKTKQMQIDVQGFFQQRQYAEGLTALVNNLRTEVAKEDPNSFITVGSTTAETGGPGMGTAIFVFFLLVVAGYFGINYLANAYDKRNKAKEKEKRDLAEKMREIQVRRQKEREDLQKARESSVSSSVKTSVETGTPPATSTVRTTTVKTSTPIAVVTAADIAERAAAKEKREKEERIRQKAREDYIREERERYDRIQKESEERQEKQRKARERDYPSNFGNTASDAAAGAVIGTVIGAMLGGGESKKDTPSKPADEPYSGGGGTFGGGGSTNDWGSSSDSSSSSDSGGGSDGGGGGGGD